MRFIHTDRYLNKLIASGLCFTMALATFGQVTIAQEDGDAKPPAGKSSGADGEDEEAEEKDPFEIPVEASIDELFEFMTKVQRLPPPSRKSADITEHAKKVFPAVIAAADLVIAESKDAEEIAKAVSSKFSSYSILVRYDPESAAAAMKLAEEYRTSKDDNLASIAEAYLLNNKVRELRGGSDEELQALSDETVAFIERFGMNKSTYGTVSSVARSLGYGDNPEIAAGLYEKMASAMRESDDERLAERADSMLGAARRMRLLGNEMDVFGTTGAGDEFQWDDYKGKVVLVDFWASWCGPCIGELPNMKKNLKLYGDKGFEIVGINMDSTREAYEKCIETKEITWVNLVSEEEGKTGWGAPMATHYGITGIPTAILVNPEGKVVSLRARGAELDKQLEELLGPVEEPEVESDDAGSDDKEADASDGK